MSQIDDALSLMERMDANDKKAQENRARRIEEYKNSKPSRDYFKRRANEQLHEYIIQCDCSYEQFYYMMDGSIQLYFVYDEWREIWNTVIDLLFNKNYFDQYCIRCGLLAKPK